MTDPYKTLALADVLESFDTYGGLRCTRVGEDGDVLILGHHAEPQIWATFAALTGDDSGAEAYDIRQTQVGWANHSEGCEVVNCSCEDDLCPACVAGNHDGCAGPDDCICADLIEPHEPGCRCDCDCDEYAWWVSDVSANGEPATWVTWSYSKARAHREASEGQSET